MRWHVGLLMAGLLVTSINASVVFHDDFSAGSSRWVNLGGSSVSLSTTEGFLRVQNSSNQYSGMIRRDSSLTNFTYSTTLRFLTQSSRAGIGFCIQSDGSGYFFMVDARQMVSVFKFVNNSYQPIKALPHSFVQKTENRLTVSRSGNRLDLFCNGISILSFRDSSFTSGSIALMVGPSSTVAYDDVEVLSTVTLGTSSTCFADQFGATTLQGWYTGLSSTAPLLDNGRLVLSRSAEHAVVFTSGDFTGASVQAIVSRQSPDSTAFYGIILVDIVHHKADSLSYHWIGLLINGKRYYAAMDVDTIRTSLTPTSLVYGTDDTLKIVHSGSYYRLYVNGRIVDSLTSRSSYSFEGAGLWADPNVAVAFDNFSVAQGDNPICPVVRTIRLNAPRSVSALRSAPTIVVDPLGRRVVRSGQTGIHNAHGVYLLSAPQGTIRALNLPRN